ESVCQALDGRLAEMLRFYAILHWGPNVRCQVGRELAATQASLKSAEASHTVMENKLSSEQCAHANAETLAQQFSADRDPAHKEVKLVKSREASLNAQISEMNAAIKSHQEMYDRLENRMQLALRSNEILTKEVNHGRSEYLVGIPAFEKSHENLHKLLSHTDPKETTLTLELRERNRDLVRRVKRLEKANSGMDPEALIVLVEGFELDKIDWELWLPILRLAVRFAEIRAEKQRKAEETAAAAGLPAPPPLMVSVPGDGNSNAAAVSLTVNPADWAARLSLAMLNQARLRRHLRLNLQDLSGGKKGKGKAKRRRTGSDDEDVDFGGGDSGEDACEEGREGSATSSSAATSQPQPKKQKASPPASPPTPAEKPPPSSKSSTKLSPSKPSSNKSPSSKSSVPAPARHKADSAPKKLDVAVSDAESMSSPRLTPKRKAAMIFACPSAQSSSKSKKSRSKKTSAKAKSGRSSSDESVISVSSESESESSSDQDSSASEGSEVHEDKESELSKLRPESQYLEDLPDDTLDAPAPAALSAAGSQAGKKKVSPKSAGKKKSSAKTNKSSLDTTLPDWISTYPELVKLAQRASDLLIPYVAPEFTTVSAQKYWVKLEQAFPRAFRR
ncbi:hypothetical protein PHMEG_00030383, partial [Phytophthora megakarya]